MWLGLSAGVANAAVTAITFTPIGTNLWGAFSGGGATASFVDYFNFTIPGAVQPVAQGVSATISAGGLITFSGFDLWDYSTLTTVATGSAYGTAGDWKVNFTIPSAIGHQLTNSYAFVVSGSPVGSSGSYSLDASITAVPEPETYAMMLAGLGLLGFAARRRKTNNFTGNFA